MFCMFCVARLMCTDSQHCDVIGSFTHEVSEIYICTTLFMVKELSRGILPENTFRGSSRKQSMTVHTIFR